MMTSRPKHNSMLPLHEQISDALIQDIRSGKLPIGSRLPGESELVKKFGTARGTVRRALRTLNENGYAQTFQGKGTFVLAGRPEPSIGQTLVGLGEALSYSDKKLTTQVAAHFIIEANESLSFPVELDKGESVLFLDRIRFLDTIPVARLKNWVRIKLAPGIEDVDFEKISLFNALDQLAICEVTSGRRKFEAVIPPEDVAQSLGLSEHVPLLFLQQVTYLSTGAPIECSDVWMDSAHIAVTALLSR